MLMYIDPGTGSMLFTILLGVIGTGTYKLKDAKVKARFFMSGGKANKIDDRCIEYAIFSDHKRYWNVFEPICDEFERREIEIVYMTASPDDPALDKAYKYVKCEFIGEGNKAFATLNTLHADIVLSTTPSLDVFYWKRSKYVKYYVHIAHAASDLTLYRMFGLDFYDAILISGDYQEKQLRALEKVRNLPEKEITMVGLPFLDEMKSRLESAGNVNKEKPVVLLAPSWGPSAIFSRFGGKIIEELLKTDYKIIIRPHPQSFTSEKEMIDDLMERFPQGERVEWNRDNDNFDVLRKADIMISDFSGVLFDYALVFDKPVIYTDVQFDASPYDACWLEEEPWTFKVLPKLGPKLTDENMGSIGNMIKRCLNDSEFEAGRKEAREETWAYIGEGAGRITNYMINKHMELNRTDKEEQTE